MYKYIYMYIYIYINIYIYIIYIYNKYINKYLYIKYIYIYTYTQLNYLRKKEWDFFKELSKRAKSVNVVWQIRGKIGFYCIQSKLMPLLK